MGILALAADERVADVEFSVDALSVALMDGRTITVPLVWYPKLLNATEAERNRWQISGGGYGIHWPDIDEDLSTEGLLRGAPAPGNPSAKKASWHSTTQSVYHNNSKCTTGNNIEPQYCQQGTGGKPLCQECNRLNQIGQQNSI
ncbi:MAG: DUF2442 domain-containing protein [Pyrinomonadaceae bacterium]|nr:DUF2442 domain-containing protein [Pyrinomonadaceae bacterium]